MCNNWSAYPGKYLTGDSAKIDADGYFWIIGRMDDVIKVSGYRLGTAEIESALVSHPAVSEAAVIGLQHELKGHSIHAFVILKAGHSGSPELSEELIAHVGVAKQRHFVGQGFSPCRGNPKRVALQQVLPKTRPGARSSGAQCAPAR